MQNLFHVLKIQPGIQDECQFILQFCRMFPHTTIQVNQITIKIVIDFKILTGILMEQDPATTAKYFDVSLVIQRKAGKDLISERLFATYPGHKAIYFFTFLLFRDLLPVLDTSPDPLCSAPSACSALCLMIQCRNHCNTSTAQHTDTP